MDETLQKLKEARAALVRKRPYLASAIIRPLVITDSLPSGTMAVDQNWNMYADPKFVASVSLAELAGVVYHEALHLALDHARRAQLAIPRFGQEIWDLAAELEVNSRIISEGVFKLPGDPPTPAKFSLPDGLLAEEYAELLSQKSGGAFGKGHGRDASGNETASENSSHSDSTDSPQNGSLEGSGVDGIPREWEVGRPLEPINRDAAVRLIAKSIQSARHNSDAAAGTVPAHLVRWADSLLTVRADRVKALVERFASVLSSLGVTPTWLRPNRRSTWLSARNGRAVLPGHVGKKVSVAVVIDTSASMSDEDISRGVKLVTQLASSAGAQVSVLCVDTEVHSVHRNVTTGTKIVPVGGGGTDMVVGIEAAAKLGPDVIVVFTDGYTPWPEEKPARAVIVALTEENDTPAWAIKVVLKGE